MARHPRSNPHASDGSPIRLIVVVVNGNREVVVVLMDQSKHQGACLWHEPQHQSGGERKGNVNDEHGGSRRHGKGDGVKGEESQRKDGG